MGGLFVTVLSFIMIMSVYGESLIPLYRNRSSSPLYLCGRAEPELQRDCRNVQKDRRASFPYQEWRGKFSHYGY